MGRARGRGREFVYCTVLSATCHVRLRSVWNGDVGVGVGFVVLREWKRYEMR